MDEKTGEQLFLYVFNVTVFIFILQSSNPTIKRCSSRQLSWKFVSQLITLLIPYLSEAQAKDKAVQLDRLLKLLSV